MIRYYGTYHPSVSRSDFVRNAHLIPAIHPTKRPFLRSLSRWRFSILASFSSDPLRCSCGSIMHFLFLKFKKTTLDNLFRKVLSYPLEHSLFSNPVLRSLFLKHNFITYVVANPRHSKSGSILPPLHLFFTCLRLPTINIRETSIDPPHRFD